MNNNFEFWVGEGNAIERGSGIEYKGFIIGVYDKNKKDDFAKMYTTIMNIYRKKNYNLLILPNGTYDNLCILDYENNYTPKEFKKIKNHIINKVREIEV